MMPAAGFVATIVLAGIVVALAIARLRSQRRLGNSSKNLERSQCKLSKRLDTLSDTLNGVVNGNSVLVSELERWVAGKGRRTRPLANTGCPYCRRTAPAWSVYRDNPAPVDSHIPWHNLATPAHQHQGDTWRSSFYWEPDAGDEYDEWTARRTGAYELTAH